MKLFGKPKKKDGKEPTMRDMPEEVQNLARTLGITTLEQLNAFSSAGSSV